VFAIKERENMPS